MVVKDGRGGGQKVQNFLSQFAFRRIKIVEINLIIITPTYKDYYYALRLRLRPD